MVDTGDDDVLFAPSLLFRTPAMALEADDGEGVLVLNGNVVTSVVNSKCF